MTWIDGADENVLLDLFHFSDRDNNGWITASETLPISDPTDIMVKVKNARKQLSAE